MPSPIVTPAKKTWLEKRLDSTFADYDFLMTMPQNTRLYAVLGYSLLNFCLAFVLHLALLSSATQSHPATIRSILSVYLWILIIIISVAVVFIIPRLRTSKVYAWCFLLSVIITGAFLGRAEVIDTFGLSEFLLLAATLTCINYGLKFYNKAVKAILNEKTRLEVEKTNLQSEARAAQQIQQKLLPVRSIQTPFYQAYGRTVSATEVGGDYFDIVPIEEQTVAVSIGDVSGHNMAAGLLVAILKSAFRTELKHCRYESGLENLLQALNETIRENSESRLFVSFQCAMIDFERKQLRLANAGHLPMFLWRKNSSYEYHPKSMALGLSQQGSFKEETLQLFSNDVLIFLTDGIIEAMNNKNEEFGLERTQSVLKEGINAVGSTPESIYRLVLERVHEFSNSTMLEDDATLVIMRLL